MPWSGSAGWTNGRFQRPADAAAERAVGMDRGRIAVGDHQRRMRGGRAQPGRRHHRIHLVMDPGLCAYVGTYCSSSFLGVCLTKRKVYCCFESKLSRILQEQGRQQLNKPWGKPKTEQCQGFTIDEFARLDLSKMDFSEVYAEFTDAARLPDELQATQDIQQKIEDYYARARQ